MFKKVLSIILAVLLLASALSVTAFADEEAPVTEIRTVEDLYMVNLDLAGNYKLMNDIDLTEATAEGGDWDFDGRGWEPIGSDGIYSNATPFTGTFDGGGHEIKGMRIDVKSKPSGTGTAYVGLFANNAGTIKNLGIDETSEVNYGDYVGGICAVNNGTVLNCYNKAVILSGNYSGGICAYNRGEISDCYNKADISSKQYSGGICGSSQSGTISDCYNSGNISVDSVAKEAFSGGICGSSESVVNNCYNTGSVTSSTKYESKGSSSGTFSGTATVYSGGICGSSSNDISTCYNTGEVSSSASSIVTNTYRDSSWRNLKPSTYAESFSYSYTGGICGRQMSGAIGNCYNTANVSSSVEAEAHYYATYYSGYNSGYYYDSSYSNGTTGTAKYTGGIAGHSDGEINCCYNTGTATKAISDSTVTSCYFLSGSGEDTTGAKSLTAVQMKLKAMYKGFDFDSTWLIDNTGDYPYPQLKDNKQIDASEPGGSYQATVIDGVVEIRTIEDLYMVNLDLAGNYKLMNDIDLSEATAEGGDWDFDGRGWEPIGSDGIYSNATPFTGTFDGGGHEIKGMRINAKSLPSGTGTAYVGLFANNAGTIKNLGIDETSEVNYGDYVGGICAVNNGTVLNCYNKAVILSGNYSGGICAYNSGEISDCYNKADISSKQYSGGICGSSQSGTISDCYNSGNISVDSVAKEAFSGGICGSSESVVNNCYNTGSVTSSTKYESKGSSSGTFSGTATVYSGGICGSSSNDISACYNTGEVSSSASSIVTNTYRDSSWRNLKPSTYAESFSYSYTGGICGRQMSGAIGNCYNTANVSSSVEAEAHYYATYYSGYNSGYYYDSSYSNGTTGTAKYTGGIAGHSVAEINCCYNTGTATKAISDSTVTSCYFLSGSGEDTTGAKSLTAVQMKLKAMYRGFDFDSTWFIDSTGEYPYTQLINNAAYPPVQPTEPVTEAPTEPVTEAPTEPVTEAPTELVTEAPTELVTEAPTEPVTEAPTEPAHKHNLVSVQAVPATATENGVLAHYKCTICEKLFWDAMGIVEITDPALLIIPASGEETTPTEPATEAPTEPATEAPTEPATEAPTEPATDAPTEPVTEAPTEPATDAPTEPATDAPTEPATDAPTEPATEAPTELVTEAPTEPATEAPTEPVTEAPTQTPTQAAQAIVTVFNGNNAETKILNVGDTFTVYTTLNTGNIDGGRISTVAGEQSYTASVLSVDEALDDEQLIVDNDRVFPVMKDKAIGNCAEPGKVYFSGTTPSVSTAPFLFSGDNSILAAVNYKVTGSGMAMVTTSLTTLAMSDIDITRIVDKGIVKNPDFTMKTSFEKPADVTYYLGDADGSGEVDAIDATVIQRYTTKVKVNYPEKILMQGDVDGDGDLTVVDATYIQRYSTRVKVPYAVGELITSN